MTDIAESDTEEAERRTPGNFFPRIPTQTAYTPAPVTGPEPHHKDEAFSTSWKSDLPASVVVFLVAVPLCLGIALASGAPLFSGIIAGVVGGLVVGALSGSALMVSGPAAGLTAIVVTAIGALGSFRAFLAAVVVAGVLQIALGLAGAGIVGYYFPSAVIKGMLAAIGLILILKQVPHAVGYDADFEGDESFLQANNENTFSGLTQAFNRMETGAVVISLAALLILIIWDQTRLKKMKLLPGPLAAVALGVGMNFLFGVAAPGLQLQAEHLVALPIPDSLAGFAGLLTSPDWSALGRPETWRIALTLAVVASLETLLSLEATDRMDPYKREAPTNRELMAQGTGNIVSGVLGGLPVTGVIVRSAANVDAGARTKASAILHGVLLLLAVLLIPAFLNSIPLASLAAILIYTGFKLAHPRLVKHAYAQGWYQFLPFVITVVAILLTDLLVGIGVGLAFGFFFILVDQFRAPCYTVVSPHGSVLTRLRLHDHVSFLNKATLTRALEGLPSGARVEIDGTHCERIDHDVLEFIADFRETAKLRGIDFRLVGISAGATSPSH